MSSPYIETNYRLVQLRLKTVAPAVGKALTTSLRLYANIVRDAARAEASSFSTQIPKAISSTVTASGAGVRVSRSVPIAPLTEVGKPWRHPLYGDRNWWYPQKPKGPPPVKTAIVATEKTALKLMESAVQKAAEIAAGG
jgi:hypothetical protein